MSAPKRYSREFKIEAVKLVTEHGMVRRQVARDLGITSSSLRTWIEQFSSGSDDGASKRGPVEDEEVRRLRRELAETKMERDILKKAVGIFSQMPRQ
jgi:transposase